MDLLELMTPGREEKSLDRLETMLALFDADDAAGQDDALERAMNFCELEWGSYEAGIDKLARRVEARANDPVQGAMEALRLREEAAEPGTLIRSARVRREREQRRRHQREAVIARYGSEEAARRTTDFERLFIEAAAGLADTEGDTDPFAPLEGWHLPWHDLPPRLAEVVSTVHPLPAGVDEARGECLLWEQRLKDIEFVYDCPDEGTLPTACAARRKVVEALWRDGLPARSVADLDARLDYWASRGGDDGAGYRILQRDFAALAAQGLNAQPREGTRERILRLKAEHPNWSLGRIGKEIGISRQAVHKHLGKAAAAGRPA